MPRPVSWLPRLHIIRKSVAGSGRSHYGRGDLETLFELKPRAAQQLMQMLPTVQVGTSRLVERDALDEFLEGVQKTDDTSSFLDKLRGLSPRISRKPLRSLVRRDEVPVSLDCIPENLRLERGQLQITFSSVDQLAETMYFLARILSSDSDRFVQNFETKRVLANEEADYELRELFEGLEQMELAAKRMPNAK